MLQRVEPAAADNAVAHCYHCQSTVLSGNRYRHCIDGVEQIFCCPACQFIASTITVNGLADYYRFRAAAELSNPVPTPNKSVLEADFSAFDDEIWQQQYLHNRDDVSAVTLLVDGVHCAACTWLLEQYLQQLPGVKTVDAHLERQSVTVQWDKSCTPLSEICQAINRLGYQPDFYTPDALLGVQLRAEKQALQRLGVAGIAMMQVGMFAVAMYSDVLGDMSDSIRDFMRWVSLLVALPVVFYAARPFFAGAWRGIQQRQAGMDLPVALAISLAFAASCWATINGTGETYFDSVVMFVFLLLAGRYLEMRARHFSGRLSSSWQSLLPTVVHRYGEHDQLQTVSRFKVRNGDRLLVKVGEVIPADGCIDTGVTRVNESQLTGEFLPVKKQPGDQVLAGSINSGDVFSFRVTATGSDLQLQSIDRLLHRAQQYKPRVVQLADQYASYFVITIVMLSLATFSYWFYFSANGQDQAFWVMLSVLVVSCPCALSLATPTAISTATSALREAGLLVTQPDVWEKLAGVSDVIFDKTGTLTRGQLTVTAVQTLGNMNREQVLALAMTLESGSEHPIANAFKQLDISRLGQGVLPPLPLLSRYNVHAGAGVEGVVAGCCYRLGSLDFVSAIVPLADSNGITMPPLKGVGQQCIVLASEQQWLAIFILQDVLRPDAAQLVATLQQRGLAVHMLSGDHSSSVVQLAAQLGIAQGHAGMRPAQKLDYLRYLQLQGKTVLMLGDGVNDIPVLAAADVAVAMVNASDLAKTQADVIALTDSLSSVNALLAMAAHTRKIIRQNIAWALLYNAAAIPLAMMGVLPPWLAALGMSLSSLVVLLNALRLQRRVAPPAAVMTDSNGMLAYG